MSCSFSRIFSWIKTNTYLLTSLHIHQIDQPTIRIAHSSSLTAAHWVAGTDTVLHRETGGGEDIYGITGVHTCVGVIVTDTVGDVRFEVSDVQGERRSPGEDLVEVNRPVSYVNWRIQ